MTLKIQFKIVLLLWILPLLTFANTNSGELVKTTKERSIKKSFNVSANATLKVDNTYGNLNIITWNENRIEFEIIIKVTGNNAEKVEERLNEIDIEFSSTKNLVTAITKIRKSKKSWWSWGNNNNLQLQIE
jgi:hypothetical protein